MADFFRTPAVILYGTRGTDEFWLWSGTRIVFGMGGNDRIRTPADSIQQEVYNDLPLPLPSNPAQFAHPVPAGVTMAYAERLWSTPLNWTADVGEKDIIKSGYGHLTAVGHGAFQPYVDPISVYGVNMEEGSRDSDRFVFNHDDIVVGKVTGRDGGDGTWILSSARVRGVSDDPHDNGILWYLNFGTDGRGPGVNRITGAGDHVQHIPQLSDDIRADATVFFREHDAVTHPEGQDFFF